MSQKEIKRAVGSYREQATVKLSQILTLMRPGTKNELLYGHRSITDYTAEKVDDLLASIRSEDMLIDMVCGETDDPDKVVLVGGHRRKVAIDTAIAKNIDPALFYEDMPQKITLIRRGKNQSEESYQSDLFIASGSDNEVRKSLDDSARLRFVKGIIELKISDDRGRIALGISETQWARLAGVAKRPWLNDMIDAGQLKLSTATSLVETIKKAGKDRKVNEASIKADLENWAADREKELAKEREKAIAIKKPLTGSQDQVSKYVSPALMAEWKRSILGGTPLTNDAAFHFGMAIKDGRLIIPGINIKVSEMGANDWRKLALALVEGEELVARPMVMAERSEETIDTQSVIASLRQEAEQNRLERLKREDGRKPEVQDAELVTVTQEIDNDAEIVTDSTPAKRSPRRG